MGVAIKPPTSMNTLTLGLLLSAGCAAVLSSPTHGGGKTGSGDKCRPTTVCSQVPSSECSTVYEERCSTPVKEVCDQVTEITQQNRCRTTYRRVCSGGARQSNQSNRGKKNRGKRSPVGILQAVLLANALGARHPENEEPEETCHNVPSHYVTIDTSHVLEFIQRHSCN